MSTFPRVFPQKEKLGRQNQRVGLGRGLQFYPQLKMDLTPEAGAHCLDGDADIKDVSVQNNIVSCSRIPTAEPWRRAEVTLTRPLLRDLGNDVKDIILLQIQVLQLTWEKC